MASLPKLANKLPVSSLKRLETYKDKNLFVFSVTARRQTKPKAQLGRKPNHTTCLKGNSEDKPGNSTMNGPSSVSYKRDGKQYSSVTVLALCGNFQFKFHL